MRKAKIVATLGPSTDSNEMLEKLILAGVNVMRFNFSHGTHEYHKELLGRVREVAKKLRKPIATLQDISGPKIRIGIVEKPIELKFGGALNFYKTEGFEDANGVTLSYPEIIDSLQVGEFIYLADGLIRVQVTELSSEFAKCKVIVGGMLTSKKGVNFPDSALTISAITEKDKADVKLGVELGFDWMAFSFMRTAEDLRDAKKLIKAAGGNTPVMVKIEKAQALTNLEEILDEVDAVMVARGDLGVELGLYKVPPAQKRIIHEANIRGLPVVTATQMMTSMIHSPFPTRAEVSDVANAVLDGTDAVMLSDETTIGEFPVEAIEALNSAIIEAETIYPYYLHIEEYHFSADATSVAAAR
ncbi:MAG: pyruvate kinase, partial [Pseudomonadota bacterium]